MPIDMYCGCDCTADCRSRSRFPVAVFHELSRADMIEQYVDGKTVKGSVTPPGQNFPPLSAPSKAAASKAGRLSVGCVRVATERLGGSPVLSLYVGHIRKTLPWRQS